VHNQCNQFVYNSIEDGCCAQRNLSFIANILLLWKHATRPMSRATHADMNHLLDFVIGNATGGSSGQPRWFHASPSFRVKVDVSYSGEINLTGDVHLCGFTEQESGALSQWIEFLGVESVGKVFVTDQYIPEQDDFLITCTKRIPHLYVVLEDEVQFNLVDLPTFNDITFGGSRDSVIIVDALSLHISEYIHDQVSPRLEWNLGDGYIRCEITERVSVFWKSLLDALSDNHQIQIYIEMYINEHYDDNEQAHVTALVHAGTTIEGCDVLYYYNDVARVAFQFSDTRWFAEVYFGHQNGYLTIRANDSRVLQMLPRIDVAQLNGDYSRQSYMDYHDNQNQVERSQRNQQAREDLLRHNEQVRMNERAAVEALQQRGSGLDAETLTRARDDTFACHKSNRILESDDPTCNYYVSNDGASAVRYGYRDTFGIGDCIPKEDIVRLRNNCYSRSALSQWFISRRAFRNEHGFGGEALHIPGLGGDAITEAELDALGIRHQ
jgi:hypothetical protein